MKKKLPSLVLIYLCCSVIFHVACLEPESEMELIVYPGSNKVHKVLPFDVNNDEIMEKVTLGSSETNYISFQSSFPPTRNAGQINVETLGDFLPKINPAEGEITVGTVHTEGYRFIYRDYNLKGKLLRQGLIVEVQDNDNSGKWEGMPPRIAGYLDSNDDGYLDPVFALAAEYDKTPRGIYVLDGKSGDILWTRNFGTLIGVSTVYVGDVVGDGSSQILLGSKASGNNVEVDGNTDFKSYVTLIDKTGVTIWENEVGGEFSTTYSLHAIDFDGDGTKEIVYHFIVTNIPRQDDPGIHVLSGKTGDLISHSGTQTDLRPSILVGDFFNTGRNNILAFDFEDNVRIYDSKLKLERTAKAKGLGYSNFFSDINGDGRKEFFSSDSEMLRVFSNDFEFIAETKLPPVKKTHFFGTERVIDSEDFNIKPGKLMLFNRAGFSRVELKETVVSQFFTAFRISNLILLPLAITGLVLTLLFVSRSSRKVNKYKDKLLNSLEDSATGALFLNSKMEILEANQAAREIVDIRSKSLETLASNSNKESLANKLFLIYSEFIEKKLIKLEKKVFIQLEAGDEVGYTLNLHDIEEGLAGSSNCFVTIRLIQNPLEAYNSDTISISQELMHKIKTLILVYKNDIHHLESSFGEESFQEDFPEVIEELKKVTSAIEGIARNYVSITKLSLTDRQQMNFNEFIKEILDSNFDTNNKNIKFVYELDSSLPEIRVNTSQIQSVVLNLVENSIEAIAVHGKITIRTEPFKKLGTNLDTNRADYLSFSVEDTGKGFDMRLAHRIFDPGFSDKAGNSGLGMTISRRIVELHGGEMVVQSVEGKGTSIAVRLPYEQ
jgi:signal transduction histidine kinase